MYIEELNQDESKDDVSLRDSIRVGDAKCVLIGAGARALFYPTLLYNVVRHKIQSEFRWWDKVDEFILLGAVPFPADVTRLRELGVCRVVTLNEPYETLVPSSLYHAHNIDHLVIPTRDYLFAPSFADICLAVDFIHENASLGKTTYIHCKAGRGCSTTIVLCYLVEHRQMTPDGAYEYVRSIRPRVLLASSQRQAVQDYYHLKVKRGGNSDCLIVSKSPAIPAEQDIEAFDDGSVVVVTELDLDGYDASCDSSLSRNDMLAEVSLICPEQDNEAFDDGSVVVVTELDLDGYDATCDSGLSRNEMLAEVSLTCRVQFVSQAAISRISCLWLRCNSGQKTSTKNFGSSVGTDHLGSLGGVDIRVC